MSLNDTGAHAIEVGREGHEGNEDEKLLDYGSSLEEDNEGEEEELLDYGFYPKDDNNGESGADNGSLRNNELSLLVNVVEYDNNENDKVFSFYSNSCACCLLSS